MEQLYGSVLDMDVALAGEADDTRKSSTLAYINKTNIRREGDKLVVDYPTAEELRAPQVQPAEPTGAGAQTKEPSSPPAGAAQPAEATRGSQPAEAGAAGAD